MNSKWCISTVLIILAFIGLNQEQSRIVNQQIILQFADAEMIRKTVVDDALATVTETLELLGISNIEILENNNHLTIRYYSDYDVFKVGEFLTENSEFSIEYGEIDQHPSNFPKDKLPESCSLVVSDIQQKTNDGLGLNGKLAFESNVDYKQYSNPVSFKINTSLSLEQNVIVQVAYKVNKNSAIAIENTSDTTPEVRAGPCNSKNSCV